MAWDYKSLKKVKTFVTTGFLFSENSISNEALMSESRVWLIL